MSPFFFGPRHMTCRNQNGYRQNRRMSRNLSHGCVGVIQQKANADNGYVFDLVVRSCKEHCDNKCEGKLQDTRVSNPRATAGWRMNRPPGDAGQRGRKCRCPEARPDRFAMMRNAASAGNDLLHYVLPFLSSQTLPGDRTPPATKLTGTTRCSFRLLPCLKAQGSRPVF